MLDKEFSKESQTMSKLMDPHQIGQMCPAAYHRELC